MNKIKKEYKIEGLSCAHCAGKIENAIATLDETSATSLNFTLQKLTLEIDKSIDDKDFFDKISTQIDNIEKGVVLIPIDKKIAPIKKSDLVDKKKLITFIVSLAMYFTALFIDLPFYVTLALFIGSYLLVGGKVLLKAINNIRNGQVFDENFLMSIATLGAFAICEFSEGVAVMIFYQVGEFFQDIAVNRSRNSISDLMDIRPDFANLKQNDDYIKVSPYDVKVDDIILVKPGEKIPLDGIVIDGESMLDTSALTGESVPRKTKIGDSVLSGTINQKGLLTIKVLKPFTESSVSKILDLVENASSKKAKTENFITKFAKYYTPVVVILALSLAIFLPMIIDISYSESINRALIFLVVSCPCALVVSIPLGFFGGIGAASKNGILIKGGNYLEALNNVDTVVFDKTGTLTKGVFEVTAITPDNDFTSDELLELSAYAESFSNHPIAQSIINNYKKEINKDLITDYEEISGHGIKTKINNSIVLVGNKKLMEAENITYNNVDSIGTIIHVAIDNKYAGNIIVSDIIKEDSSKAIEKLKACGVKRTVMLTGDNKHVADSISKKLKLDEVYSELLPDGKVDHIEKLFKSKSTKGVLVFVGDGINDAPVLARADVGISMGGIGSDAAIEASDVVLMTDEPSKIATTISIAKVTRKIVWQNIIFALVVKAIVLILGAGGVATMWEAVFADVGVTLIAIFNSMRVMRRNYN